MNEPSSSSPPPSSISPISITPPVLREIATESDEALDVFEDDQFYSASLRSTKHGHITRHRGSSVQEKAHSRQSTLQIPVIASASLPTNYGSRMQPTTPLHEKPPSMMSFDSSASSGTFESSFSSQSPFVERARDGSVEAGTLNGLIEHLITDSSSEFDKTSRICHSDPRHFEMYERLSSIETSFSQRMSHLLAAMISSKACSSASEKLIRLVDNPELFCESGKGLI